MTARICTLLGLAVVVAVPLALARGQDAPPTVEIAAMTTAARVDLESNLRWMLARARSGKDVGAAEVGVYADAGAWPLGARSVVAALESSGTRVRVLDRSQIDGDGLAGLKAIVLPGGWAPFQRDALGSVRLQAVASWVRGGGHVLGICAGGYLLTSTVRWEAQEYPYPLGLFPGTAEGPVEGLAPWPNMAPVRVAVSAAGKRAGLGAAADADYLYFGGARYVDMDEDAVLARYPDGSAAVIRVNAGKGVVTLSGIHFERPAPDASDSGPPPAAGKLLRALLALPKR